MDYGPTIAAAFAAREEEMIHSPTHRGNRDRNRGYNRGDGGVDVNIGDGDGEKEIEEDDGYMDTTNDVASLRKIILGCMRNARDAALVASRRVVGEGGGRGRNEYGAAVAEEDAYRGRYSNDGGHYNNDDARGVDNRSGSANMGYHQAFSAESSPRRRARENNEVDGMMPPVPESVKTEESPAANGVIDLLG